MSADKQIFLLWTDLETTGLVPGQDKILEIAWAITDTDLSIVGEPRSHVIEQENWIDFFNYWRHDANQAVIDMHTENGLFEELKTSEDLSNLDRAFLELDADLSALPDPKEVHLAGRSVDFDKRFLLANDFGSLFDNRLGPRISHRVFDVRTLKTFFQMTGLTVPVKEAPSNHRALDDVLGDIRYARAAREMILHAYPFPPVTVEKVEI